MYTPKAELKAGLVVLAALSVLGVFLYRASGSRLPWAHGDTLSLRFEQGFAAPSKGDAVRMNGLKIGVVESVTQKTELRGAPDKDGRTIPLTERDRARLKLRPGEPGVARELYVAAVVELLFEDQKIPKGTRGEISVSVTGEKTLSLLPGLSPDDLIPSETAKEPILTTAAGDISAVMKEAEDVVRKIGGVVDDVKPAVADVRAALGEIRRKVEQFDLTEIQSNILDGSKDLRAALGAAKSKLDEIGSRMVDAAGNVKGLTDDAKQGVKDLIADLKDVAGHLKSASAEIDAVVARNSKKVDEILDNITEVSKSVTTVVREFDGLGTRLKGVVGEAGDDLGRFLARMSEVGHNLSDITEDLRAHPWKLLNKPEEKEIAFENVRNAATNLVRTQRTIEESLQRLRELEGRADLATAERTALLKKAYESLKGDLQRYDEASRYFLNLLKSGAVQAPR